MIEYQTPTVIAAGSTDAEAPLVILFRGRGSQASEIISLVDHLPLGPSYIALNAPIYENGGYAWFANKGIGRPVAESLSSTTQWFEEWLSQIAPSGKKIILIGFSGGGAFVGGLIGRSKSNYAAAAILYATLPWDAGIPLEPQQFAGFPIAVLHGESDHVIPADLLKRTWDYLTIDSGADLTSGRGPEGHGITKESLAALNNWLKEQLTTENKQV